MLQITDALRVAAGAYSKDCSCLNQSGYMVVGVASTERRGIQKITFVSGVDSTVCCLRRLLPYVRRVVISERWKTCVSNWLANRDRGKAVACPGIRGNISWHPRVSLAEQGFEDEPPNLGAFEHRMRNALPDTQVEMGFKLCTHCRRQCCRISFLSYSRQQYTGEKMLHVAASYFARRHGVLLLAAVYRNGCHEGTECYCCGRQKRNVGKTGVTPNHETSVASWRYVHSSWHQNMCRKLTRVLQLFVVSPMAASLNNLGATLSTPPVLLKSSIHATILTAFAKHLQNIRKTSANLTDTLLPR